MTLDTIAQAMGATCRNVSPATSISRVTTDSRECKAGDLFFAIPGERFDGHDFFQQAIADGVSACVCNRTWLQQADPVSTSLPILVVTDTIEALGELACYYRTSVMRPSTTVIAVTGSNGKTTTKHMLDHVLSGSLPGQAAPKSFNNHLGVPLTLLAARATDRYLIVEIGSNSPGEVAALSAITSPHAGVITSIGQAHLEGLGSVEGVAQEKSALLEYIRPHGLAVVNIDEKAIEPHLGKANRTKLFTVGNSPAARLHVSHRKGDLRSSSFELEGRHQVHLSMPGTHHATNATITFAVARWLGLAPAEIIERLQTFVPPEGRTRHFSLGRVTVIDDAYNANPSSMITAIHTLAEGIDHRRMMVMGDMLELGSNSENYHRQMVEVVSKAGIEILITVGPMMAEAVRASRDQMIKTRTVVCQTAEQASKAVFSFLPEILAVWIKGSRAMGLDRIVGELKEHQPQFETVHK